MLHWLDEKLQMLNPQTTRDENGGYTRLGFSEEEQLAMKAFIEIANELNLVIRKDEIGNLIAQWPGSNPTLPHIATGSHLDTVKNGGAYDGAAGVLAGLGVIKQLQSLKYTPSHTIEVICFISEESSRFGVPTIGSKAMTGQLEIDKIKHLTDPDGTTIQDAMEHIGVNLSEISRAERKGSELHSFVELHIEQGIVLENADCNVGIVSGISSPLRYKVQINGVASHSGSTLMEYRKDAMAIAGRIITFIEELGKSESQKDHFVSTVTTADVSPNVMNVIPGSVTLGIDIRSTNDQLKQQSQTKFENYCKSLSASTGVDIKLIEIANEPAVLMNEQVMNDLMEVAGISNKSHMKIMSGAGHDAMNMAAKWKSGMLFIPCKDGISHHPNEYAKTSDILNGIDVLTNYIKLIDQRMVSQND
ncbi:M20 family metallo-hydrolase [Bacillus sp. Marseille-P3661]|uniref:M20 family metallo-hydrolase n=1 Tax=Bacillus sp. Marseille-P3661 TaxID=1936234 RepID=UPI0015E17323|nr:M20 family metallo-hydrolase [Bacillus sp. Marseille-P3661]